MPNDQWTVEYVYGRYGPRRWALWSWFDERAVRYITKSTFDICVQQARHIKAPVRLRHVATGNLIPLELL